MGDRTPIEWADASWPIVNGCDKVSPGCKHCYALKLIATRLKHQPKYAGLAKMTPGGPVWTGEVRLWEDHLDWPLRWREPRKIFVADMGDLFHANVPDEAIDRVFAVMALAHWHTFQVLTKRPERIKRYFEGFDQAPGRHLWAHERIARLMDQPDWIELPRGRSFPRIPAAWPLPNVWLGTSVEDQATADARIPRLLETPATLRFVSAEPLLGPVDFRAFIGTHDCLSRQGPCWRGFSDELGDVDDEEDQRCPNCGGAQVGVVNADVPSLDWIIVGGESGGFKASPARPFDVSWARSIIRQCRAAGVAPFVKQLGARPMRDANPATEDPTFLPKRCIVLRDRKGGEISEWPEDLRVREFPAVAP